MTRVSKVETKNTKRKGIHLEICHLCFNPDCYEHKGKAEATCFVVVPAAFVCRIYLYHAALVQFSRSTPLVKI